MKVLKIILAILTIIVLSFSSSFSASKQIMPIYTPGAGGTGYFLMSAIASILNKYIPEVQMNVEATPGGSTFYKFIDEKYQKNQVAFGIFDSIMTPKAYKGEAPFPDKYSSLRTITFLYGAGFNFVVLKNSPIKSYFDFKGKRVAVGAAGSVSAGVTEKIIEACGITPNMYKRLWLGYNEVVEGLKDASIDTGVITGAYPIPAISELSLTKEIRVIPVDETVSKKIIVENPNQYYKDILKPGAYKGIDKETPLLFMGISFGTHIGAEPELIYKITKVLFEHRDELIATYPIAKEMTLEKALYTLPVPSHPGAEKYFKETGVIK